MRTGVLIAPREEGKALPSTPSASLSSALLSRPAATLLPVAHRHSGAERPARCRSPGKEGGAGELQREPGRSHAREGQVTPCLALLAYS